MPRPGGASKRGEEISVTLEPSKTGKRKSHPTSKARNRRQKAKKKAARERESASESGVAGINPARPGRQGRVT